MYQCESVSSENECGRQDPQGVVKRFDLHLKLWGIPSLHISNLVRLNVGRLTAIAIEKTCRLDTARVPVG